MVVLVLDGSELGINLDYESHGYLRFEWWQVVVMKMESMDMAIEVGLLVWSRAIWITMYL